MNTHDSVYFIALYSRRTRIEKRKRNLIQVKNACCYHAKKFQGKVIINKNCIKSKLVHHSLYNDSTIKYHWYFM